MAFSLVSWFVREYIPKAPKYPNMRGVCVYVYVYVYVYIYICIYVVFTLGIVKMVLGI